MTSIPTEKSPYVQKNVGGLVSKVSWYARKRMFESFMKMVKPSAETLVLDVGVTSDRREDSNFFEKLYPYPQQLTASGLEDASFLEQDHPGVKFVLADGLSLPFPDQSFDVVVSFAVIEHVGNRQQQAEFLKELCRVGRLCLITTPNRWYPIEFHTILPLVHWLPPAWFRAFLRTIGQSFYAEEQNLNLLSDRDLRAMIPAGAQVRTQHFRLLGLVSNLVFLIQP